MSALDKLTSLQLRVREALIASKITMEQLQAAGMQKWEDLTDEQCYELLGDSEIVVGDPHAKPDIGAAATAGKLAKAQHLCSDLANANRLKRTFGKKILSIGGEFFGWTGTHWARSINGEAHQYAGNLSQIVGKEAKTARDKADATQGEWESTITPEQRAMAALHPRKHPLPKRPDDVIALDKEASALEAWSKECEMKYRKDQALTWLRETHTLDPTKLDQDNWLFNCANGTVDLRTGELREHRPDDLITFCAPVRYDPDAKAPLFERFINEIVGEPTAKFLQRWYGSALTGIVREHHLVILWGKGRNGKGALIRTLEHVLGEYAGTAPPHLVADNGRGNERHATEIMTLRGRRLVTAHESDKGAVLREGFIKQMTGGDTLMGRFMRKDFVPFLPTHKAQLLTNYKPEVHGQDDGIWGRLLLVSFPNKYKSAEDVAAGNATHVIDLTLEERLRAESPGILNWLIQGALDWRVNGLKPAEAVLKASREYQSEQDRIGEFIRERCVLDPAAQSQITGSSEALYVAYQGWCRENGFNALGSRKLRQELVQRPGIREDKWYVPLGGNKYASVRGVCGIRLGSEELPDDSSASKTNGASAASNGASAASNGAADDHGCVDDKPNGATHAPMFPVREQLMAALIAEIGLSASGKPLGGTTAGELVDHFITSAQEIVDAASNYISAINPAKYSDVVVAELKARALNALEKTQSAPTGGSHASA